MKESEWASAYRDIQEVKQIANRTLSQEDAETARKSLNLVLKMMGKYYYKENKDDTTGD